MTKILKRRTVLKGLAGGVAAATTVTAGIVIKAAQQQPDAKIMALWDEFKAIYSKAGPHTVIVADGVVVDRLDRSANDVWKDADLITSKTPVGVAAVLAMQVLSVTTAVIADEWLAGDDDTVTYWLGYRSPFHSHARDLATVTGLDLEGLQTPQGWKHKTVWEMSPSEKFAEYINETSRSGARKS